MYGAKDFSFLIIFTTEYISIGVVIITIKANNGPNPPILTSGAYNSPISDLYTFIGNFN